ncbi:MAG: DUF3048 domain-containing protein [Oscillospiraceae bacterium]|jgi:hypothetical protein|nr:DUF3048 domain-containing protein [Oscillospiraceae bacterium]
MAKEPGQQKNVAKRSGHTPTENQSALQNNMTLQQKQRQTRVKRIIILGVFIFVILAVSVTVMALTGVFFQKSKAGTDDPSRYTITTTQAPENVKRINPLTGLRDLDPKAAGKRGVSFMVNNAPAARPQWGLCSPEVVIETLVEGGITRMLYMFSDVNMVPKVGPIRSARHDFVELTEGFDSFLVHWGGSPQAYEAIRARKVNDLDGMAYSGKYFFRDKTRLNQGLAVEHTAYTNGEYIAQGIAAKGWRTDVSADKTSPFRFVTEDAKARTPSAGTASAVNFRFSVNFKYSFKYNENTGFYTQSLNNTPFVQDGGQQRKVMNIILIYVDIRNIEGDKKHRVTIDMSGGNGIYVTAGGWELITWKKGKPADPLKFYDKNGTELELNRGKGYIGLVPLTQKSNTSVVE